MYAHQVIEDISFQTNKIIEKQRNMDQVELLSSFIAQIRQSQKFHIDDLGWMSKTVNNDYLQITDFLEKFKKYIKLPYNRCWIDATLLLSDEIKNTIKAGGKLVKKIGWLCYNQTKKHINVIPFWNVDGWEPMPAFGVIDLSNNQCLYKFYNIKSIVDELGKGIDKEFYALNISKSITNIMEFLVLLNCKNITATKIKRPDKLNKKRKKIGKVPIFSYHVLEITQPKHKSSQSNEYLIPSSKRIHLCRGHFKEYTKENPLFGKCTGLYWWQPHVRGDKKKGVVIKDYKIKKL